MSEDPPPSPATPPTPSPGAEAAKQRVAAEIERVKRLLATAAVEFVGQDHDYVPDAPHAREGHPNRDDLEPCPECGRLREVEDG